MPFILYVFALTNLVIGTGAFVLSGILQPLAASLHVSVAAAGQVMTAYALASATLAPLLLLATGSWPRKRAIALALLLFASGSVLCASAGSLTALLAGRVLMGTGSVFSALAAGLTVALVAPERRGSALSLAFLGMSLSYAIGVPLGAWLGFTYGWQTPVWLVAGASVLALALLMALLPSRVRASSANFAGLGDAARQWPVLRVWLRTMLYFTAISCVFTYIGPVLLALSPITPAQLSFTLVVFGLSGVAGTILGGLAVDRMGPLPTIRVLLALLAAMMALLPVTRGQYVLTLAALVVWGMAGFGSNSPQQVLLVARSPQHAPMLISLNGSMVYVGTAAGAVIGGMSIATLGFDQLAWLGLPFALLAIATLGFDTRARLHPAN